MHSDMRDHPFYRVTLDLLPDEGNDHPSRWDWSGLLDLSTPVDVVKVEEIEQPSRYAEAWKKIRALRTT